MLTPTEVVAQFIDYGYAANLREGVPFCPLSRETSSAYVREIMKMADGLGLGGALFAEGMVITPQRGMTMHVSTGKTVVGKIQRV